ncbi:hypothetical protein C8R44DRAFT_748200 [Mycena epipterygia]|nr:hypothetical protein C8R44DRAFT_748200 [Mycena epipterygia]
MVKQRFQILHDRVCGQDAEKNSPARFRFEHAGFSGGGGYIFDDVQKSGGQTWYAFQISDIQRRWAILQELLEIGLWKVKLWSRFSSSGCLGMRIIMNVTFSSDFNRLKTVKFGLPHLELLETLNCHVLTPALTLHSLSAHDEYPGPGWLLLTLSHNPRSSPFDVTAEVAAIMHHPKCGRTNVYEQSPPYLRLVYGSPAVLSAGQRLFSIGKEIRFKYPPLLLMCAVEDDTEWNRRHNQWTALFHVRVLADRRESA